MAALTISDTGANPSARTKFAASTRKIGGYPRRQSAPRARRFSSPTATRSGPLAGPDVHPADRDAWLEKFKLDALAAIRK